MDLNQSLKGKIAVVCGASGGIGKAIAHALASLDCRVVLLARNADKLKKVSEELPNSSLHHEVRVADFSDLKSVTAAAQDIAASFEVNILINNTGGPPAGPIVEAESDQFQQAFDQHLQANHVLTQHFIESMKTSGYGRIINIISTSVKIPLHGLGVSNTIRGAVASWSKTMSNELAVHGITVNNVLPGATNTGRLQEIINNKAKKTGKSESEIAASMQDAIPMHRFAEPAEVANVAAFLASPYASYVTGVSIPVDGGRTGTIS